MSVLHPSGLRSTYEPLVPLVRVGQQVTAGEPIGRLAAGASHCRDRGCLHLGALRGRAYVDPLLLLRGGPVVLLPVR